MIRSSDRPLSGRSYSSPSESRKQEGYQGIAVRCYDGEGGKSANEQTGEQTGEQTTKVEEELELAHAYRIRAPLEDLDVIGTEADTDTCATGRTPDRGSAHAIRTNGKYFRGVYPDR